MKVLVIEDQPEVVLAIQACFQMRWPDAFVVATQSGAEAVSLVESEAPDIAILDLGLPDTDGLQVLKEIRSFSDMPIIIVTANDEEMVKITGLELGADDYIVKPFSHIELMARAKAVLRRAHMVELRNDQGVLIGGNLSIDISGHRLLVDGLEVDLTPTEWSLLAYLVRNETRTLSHRALAEKVWNSEFVNNSTIAMCVRRLRQKIGDNPSTPSIIRTHRGIGYSFAMPRM